MSLAHRRTLRVQDLADGPFVSLAGGNATRAKFDALFKNHDVHRQNVFDASWSAAGVGFVAQGLGASIVDPFSADTARALGCSVHRLTPPVPFSFAELTLSAAGTNPLAAVFSTSFDACFRHVAKALEASAATTPSARAAPRPPGGNGTARGDLSGVWCGLSGATADVVAATPTRHGRDRVGGLRGQLPAPDITMPYTRTSTALVSNTAPTEVIVVPMDDSSGFPRPMWMLALAEIRPPLLNAH